MRSSSKFEDEMRSSKFFVATSYFELGSSQFEVAPQVVRKTELLS